LKIIQLLSDEGAEVMYHDPHVPEFRGLRNYPEMAMKSIALNEEVLVAADLALLVTDHTAFDYAFIERHAKCIVDTRNAFEKKGIRSEKIHKA
jgi:UDP-N-acetyl-D-glucosamine dehydrogenase